jgi:hypothetical protein
VPTCKKKENKMTVYKGYIIAKYETANGGTRWLVEDQQGNELLTDQTRKFLCIRYIDSMLKAPI